MRNIIDEPTVRAVRDELVLDRLRMLARMHHRSLQGEVRAILAAAARRVPRPDADEELDLVTVATGRSDTWTRQAIYNDDAR